MDKNSFENALHFLEIMQSSFFKNSLGSDSIKKTFLNMVERVSLCKEEFKNNEDIYNRSNLLISNITKHPNYSMLHNQIKFKKEIQNLNSNNSNTFDELILQKKYLKAYELINYITNKSIYDSYRNKLISAIVEDFHLNPKQKIEIPAEINNQVLKNLYIYSPLKKFDFLTADENYQNYNYCLSLKEYELEKAKYIKKYFEENLKIKINEEQSLAIAKTTKNLLVTARAGSGKTRTIACRAIYAIEKEEIKPEEIMIVAFNKKAALEISDRILKNFKYKKFNAKCARTFHSLAYGIYNPTEDIIWDDTNDDVRQKLSQFIAKLYHSPKIWTKNFQNLFYEYFRSEELISIDKHWKFTSDADRYCYYRNLKNITLKGEHVKSNGEKWIADFLFEHNINYKYEKIVANKNKMLYRPDFTIFHNDKNIIIEHWGIDENDVNQSVPEYWSKTWMEYKQEMNWKRCICKEKGIKLLETSINDLKEGRTVFESKLKNILENNGISCNRLPQETLLAKIDAKYKDEMAKKFATFIQTANKHQKTPDDILNSYKGYHLSERANAFIELAVEIYKEYDNELKKQNKIDFDNLLELATKEISMSNGHCEILLGKIKQKVKNIKLFLIDEYQDFSELFYCLVKEIQKANPNVKLFCVGDDWQAINGFAGSNLKYFQNFKEIFKNSTDTALSYNYRSGEKIVNLGNEIMIGNGIPAKCFRKNIADKLTRCFVDDVRIYKDNSQEFDKEFMYDGGTFFDINYRYFKLCYSIINNNPNKSYIIMDRTNNIAQYYPLNEFKNALIKKFKQKNIDIDLRVNTIHKFKGAEADIAIILECDNKNFPLIHPDNEIYYIFGKTPQDILDEERRLFYVAVTRAKEQVYFLSEKNIEYEFVQNNRNIECFSNVYM